MTIFNFYIHKVQYKQFSIFKKRFIENQLERSWFTTFVSDNRGFTFAELVLVIAIIAMLFSLVGINLFRAQRKVSLDTTVQSLITDSKSQQNKAMVGASDGRASGDNYGIYFTSTSYTLFHGLVYNPTDPANFKINLDNNLSFSPINISGNTIVFLQQSGEVATFSAIRNTITVNSLNDLEKETITINRYGVITNVQ